MMEGKIALITGSAMGIGKACAEALLKKGAKVCLSDVNAEAGRKTLEEMTSKYGVASVIFIACDVTKKDDMEKLFSETKKAFGTIDIVCNNAGIQNETKWEPVVDVNVNGVIRGTLLALQYMGKDSGDKGGVIVNTASIAGMYATSSCPVYAATKHAVVGLTRSYASDVNFAHYGVRVNCLCPFAVDTNLCNIGEVLPFQQNRTCIFEPGLISPETVAEAFMQLVEDESKNGESAQIAFKQETKFIQSPVFEL